MPLQDMGVMDDIHAKKLGSSTDSPLIQTLAPQEQNTSTHNVVIDDSTNQLVDEMTIEGTITGSALSSDFVTTWMHNVQLGCIEELKELYGD